MYVHIMPLHWCKYSCIILWCKQGHLSVATVLDAARLAGPHGLGAALDSSCDSLIRGPGKEQLAPADRELNRISYAQLPELMELVIEWAAGVLAERSAACAEACGALQGSPAPAHKPSFPRTDAWATEAWPGLADIVVTLVLRSVSACCIPA